MRSLSSFALFAVLTTPITGQTQTIPMPPEASTEAALTAPPRGFWFEVPANGQPFKITGLNYSITSACATSAHCIGAGAEQIQWGKQDIVFAGGGEELHWTLSILFDAMPALSSKYNDTPHRASRAYDVNRDGFVIAGGGGAVALEELLAEGHGQEWRVDQQ